MENDGKIMEFDSGKLLGTVLVPMNQYDPKKVHRNPVMVIMSIMMIMINYLVIMAIMVIMVIYLAI